MNNYDFEIQIICEGYGFIMEVEKDKELSNESRVTIPITYEELNALIKTFNDLKTIINYNRKENE